MAEEQIIHLSDVEHARQRPGMYVGSVTVDEHVGWCTSEVANGAAHILRYTTVKLIPALCKIIDEIMCNAADRVMFDCTRIDLEFTQLADGLYQFRIRNNGSGIPIVAIDDKPGSPLGPTACFGLTRTGTNFGDHGKTASGTNGMGSTLANIFCALFNAITCDTKRGLRWEQTWCDSISEETSDPEPTVTKLDEPSHTQITMIPDYEYFQEKNPEADLPEILDGCISYLMRRAFEIAAFCGDHKTLVRIHHRYEDPEQKPSMVTISDGMAPYRNFREYVEALVSGQASFTNHQAAHYNVVELSNTHRWRVYMVYPNVEGIAAKAPPIPGMALVNAISCLQGKHVDHVKNTVDRHMRNVGFLGDNRSITTNFRKNATLFIACRVENIAFDSQTKDKLTTPEKKWQSDTATQGSLFEFSDTQARAILASGLEDSMQALMGVRPPARSTKRPNIPKLEDANNAGKPGTFCALIITEGDSAKSLVMSGRKELTGGSDNWGVYPVRGKMINSRKKSDKEDQKNKDPKNKDPKNKDQKNKSDPTKSTLQNLVDVIGLRHKVTYADTSSLRYQRLVFMTDQDTDGDHIKGLLINLIEYHWPSLAAIPGFICSIETPLLKAFPAKSGSVLEFTSVAEYDDWVETLGNDSETRAKNLKKYNIRYYKGLGSSTNTDGRKYFKTLDEYLSKGAENKNFVTYKFDEKAHESLELVFGTDTEKRKEWILHGAETEEYRFCPEQTVTNFLDMRVKKYSEASNRRAIANLMDGLKPTQRKVLYTALRDRLTESLGVVPFSGRVMDTTNYHHGETSLYGTVVGLARKYVGGNNINFLYPDGIFGSRASHKPSGPRYLKTRLSKITRHIFPQDADPILEFEVDDGKRVEPSWFLPVIPVVLLNGCQGTGTGWKTFIPPHNPVDLITRIRSMIESDADPEETLKEFPGMIPYYRGFHGFIRQVSAFKYEVIGCLEDKARCVDVRGAGDRQWRVTEFDPTMTIEQYSKFITELKDEEGRNIFVDVHKDNGDSSIEFVMFPRKDWVMPADAMERLRLFGLVSSIDVGNMYLFVPEGDGLEFRKYDTTEKILLDFYHIRLAAYERQRQHMMEKLRIRIRYLGAKERFILAAIKLPQDEGALVIANRKRRDVRADALRVVALTADHSEYEDLIDDFLDMSLTSLTLERVEALRKELQANIMELEELELITGASLWLDDLECLENALSEPEEI